MVLSWRAYTVAVSAGVGITWRMHLLDSCQEALQVLEAVMHDK